MTWITSRRPAALSVAILAVVAVGLGGGWALAAPGGAIIHACANKKTGSLRLARKCNKKVEKTVSWNAQGPRGLAGPRGKPGTNAIAGPPTGPAGGALTGSYPNPTLNVTGGDSGATACKNGEALTGLSATAALTCGPGIYSDSFHNVAAGPTALPPGAGLASLNSALGSGALAGGYLSSAFGADALGQAGAGVSRNSAFGAQALYSDRTGSDNTALGFDAGENISTGSDDIAIGAGNEGGGQVNTGSNDIEIGSPGATGSGESAAIRIGDPAVQNSAYLAGVTGVSISGPDNDVLVNGSGQLGTATASLSWEKLNIQPLSSLAPFVLKLHPVSYRYKPRYASAVNPTQYGLIAQQVERILPALVQHGRNGQPTGVYYQELPVLLLAEVQRQQRQINQLESQNRRINALQAKVDALMRHRVQR